MGYIKIDDNFFRHPKAIQAGRDGRILFIAGICYCGNSLTDGFVPSGAVAVLGAETGISKPSVAAQTLTEVGLWETTRGGFIVHDYLDYNTASEKVQAERVAARERMQRRRSPEVRPNKSRSSPNVRIPETETETETSCSTEQENERAIKSDPKPKSSKATLVGLPADFSVTEQMRQWARDRKKLTDIEIDQRTEHFLNYVEKTGKQYASWPAAWRDSMDWIPKNNQQLSPNGTTTRRTGGAALGGMTPQELDEYAAELARQGQ